MDPRLKFRFIKPVDYEQLKATTQQYRERSKDIEAKISVLAHARDTIKNEQIIRQQAQVWTNEMKHLMREEHATFDALNHLNLSELLETSEVADLQTLTIRKFQEFKSLVMKPIWTLNSDLKDWISGKQKGRTVQPAGPIEKLVKEMLQSIQHVLQHISGEEDKLNQDSAGVNHSLSHGPFQYEIYDVGIPEEAWDWPNPDESLLTDLLSEFIHLDSRFMQRLKALRDEYEGLHTEIVNDWTDLERKQFDVFWDMFQRHCTSQRRSLALNFIARLLPQRTMQQLNKLADVRTREYQLCDRATSMTHSWKRCRHELSVRIKSALLQAKEITEQRRLGREQLRSQLETCASLHKQVEQWRKEKAELAELEEQEAQIAKEREIEQEAQAIEKERSQRNKIKANVIAYRKAQDDMRYQQEEGNFQRLKLLRAMHEKQARIDTARLLAAEKLRLSSLCELRKRAAAQADESRKARDQRLEELRQQVRPAVNADPERVLAGTLAWKSRMEERMQETEKQAMVSEVSRVLDGKLNTFNDAQLYADRRTRLTAALHSAGLLDTQYARDMLGNICSNHVPRRDMLGSQLPKD